MSRRPGIGAEWYAKYGQQTYDHDSVVINGREVKPPKFYDDKHRESDRRQMEAVSRRRALRARERDPNGEELDSPRLMDKERFIRAKVHRFNKERL